MLNDIFEKILFNFFSFWKKLKNLKKKRTNYHILCGNIHEKPSKKSSRPLIFWKKIKNKRIRNFFFFIISKIIIKSQK